MARLDLVWAEPLTWVVLAAAFGWVSLEYRRRGALDAKRSMVIGLLGLWLVATLAITIYPIASGYVDPGLHRLEVKSLVPLWGTIESFANADGYIMTEEEWLRRRAELAAEWGASIEEENLDRRVRGPGSAVLKDPIGNLLLFVPLGFLGAAGWSGLQRTGRMWLVGAAISGLIELSQLFLGLGSLGTIDDVIFNSLGALVGLGLYRVVAAVLNRVTTP